MRNPKKETSHRFEPVKCHKNLCASWAEKNILILNINKSTQKPIHELERKNRKIYTFKIKKLSKKIPKKSTGKSNLQNGSSNLFFGENPRWEHLFKIKLTGGGKRGGTGILP
jgi:hypothetical protein